MNPFLRIALRGGGGGLKIANRRFEAIRANCSHVMKIVFFFCESIRANRPDSRCESPGHLRKTPCVFGWFSWLFPPPPPKKKEGKRRIRVCQRIVSGYFQEQEATSPHMLCTRDALNLRSGHREKSTKARLLI